MPGLLIEVGLDLQAGNGDQQMQSAAAEMLTHLAGMKDMGLATLAHLTQPVNNVEDSRPILGRLHLISALLGKFDVNKGPAVHGGLEVNSLTVFLASVFTIANPHVWNAVQDAALKVGKQVCRQSSPFLTISMLLANNRCPLYYLSCASCFRPNILLND